MSADVVVRFIGDVSDLNKSVGQVEGTGSKIKSWAVGVGAAIGAAFAVDQVKQFIGAASDLNETISKTDQVFGTAAGGITKWSESAATALGMSQQEALAAASGFGNMFNQLGIGTKESAGLSKGMVQLASDIASFHNVDPTAVIEAQASAFRGEYDALQKFVPTINAAAVQTKALAMTGKDNASALTEQEKALATNALILEGAGKAAGDFARTQDSVANQTRIANAQWKDTQAALGQALLPIMQAFLPLVTKLAAVFEKFAPILVPLVGVIAGIVAAMKVWTAVQWAWNAAMSANPIGAIILGIMALIAVVVLIIKHWDDIKAAAQAAWDLILSAVQFVFNWLKENWPTVLAILTGPFGIAVLLITKNWDSIKDGAAAVIGWLKDNWPKILAILTGPFGIAIYLIVSQWDSIKGFFSGLIDAIGNIVGKVTHLLFSPFKSAYNLIKGLFDDIKGAVSDVIGAIGFAKGIYNGFAKSWNAIELKVPEVDLPFGIGKVGGQHIGLPDIPILGAGGIVNGPTLALIGERGREAVVPLPRGSSLGGGTNNYSIKVDVKPGSSPAAVGAAIVGAIQQFERVNGRAWRSA